MELALKQTTSYESSQDEFSDLKQKPESPEKQVMLENSPSQYEEDEASCSEVPENDYLSETYEEVEYLESDTGEMVASVLEEVFEEKLTRRQCSVCSVLFKHEFSLKKHLWTFHKKSGDVDPMVCQICSYRFEEHPQREDTLVRLVQKHQTQHETGKHLCCTLCPELFKSKQRLSHHIEDHKNRAQGDSRNRQKCKACNTDFSSFKELNQHLNQTTCKDGHERPFKCYICNESFAMGKKKKEHIQNEHPDKAGADCPLCFRCKIPSALAFENHYKTHFASKFLFHVNIQNYLTLHF